MTPARLASYLLWQARLARKWWSGSDERHLAIAHWRGEALRRSLARMARSARAEGRELVIVALVEHFGDVLAAEPIFRAVQRKHPEAVVVHVVGERWRPLTSAHPEIDRQVGVGCLSEWYLASGRTGAVEYDLHLPGRVCDVCQSITRPTAPAAPISIDDYYEHGCLLDIFGKIAGIDTQQIDRRPRLHLPAETAGAVDRLDLPEKFIVVHCRSNQAKRDWPAAKWDELVRRLRSAGQRIVEVGLEPALSPEVRDIDLTGRLSLTETAEMIRRASGFIGIDSGPAHMANAAGVPGVILLAHYGRFLRRMPYSGDYADGSRATVIQYEGAIDELPVELAWQAVEDRLLDA